MLYVLNDLRMVVRDIKHSKDREETMTKSLRTKLTLCACAMCTVLALAACAAQPATSSVSTSSSTEDTEVATSAAASEQAIVSSSETEQSSDENLSSVQDDAGSVQTSKATMANALGTVSNTIAQDEDALVATYPSKFTQETYEDESTGLSVTYNLFLPQNYNESASYPMVVFIADSSCAKGNPEQSLTQGLGALVWATDEWQAANPCIVCVPTYPETILDDHSGYTTTEYVELTKRLIDSVAGSYAVDTNRIYGTGQSMGCMTTLILASEYPDLYAGCMFVDGQWDVSTLQGLEGQSFVYFAAEDDERAFAGMSEVRSMFDADSVAYASAEWDGAWTCDELSAAAEELFGTAEQANFISWKTGTIDAGSGSGGGPGGGASYHMASFDYAYNCIAVMEWLFQQSN